MKKLLLLAALTIGQPLYKGMIIRFDPDYSNPVWTCEFGFDLSTGVVNGNVVLTGVKGCLPDPKAPKLEKTKTWISPYEMP